MILRKDYIDRDTVEKFFPMLISDNPEYKYFIEVTVLTVVSGQKKVQPLHITASRERESDGMVFRELLLNIPCLRSALDKPMLQSQREKIYAETKSKLYEKALKLEAAGTLPQNHPYTVTLSKM